jgi:23S rRNA (cytosine1962-C5)-methyltransferase
MDLHLKSGKDRPVRFGHPWIFSGAIRDLQLDVEAGSIVRVFGADGNFLGVGYVNPRCPIAVRMLSSLDEEIDGVFVRRRVESALSLRRMAAAGDTTAYRLINGEGDRFPGIIVDRYGGLLVLQLLTAGAERMRPLLIEALQEVIQPQGILERSEGAVRRAEGLAGRTGVAYGDVPEEVEVSENGIKFVVHPGSGQKTGFFLDQRDNRNRLRQIASGRRVLDAFAYSGGFALAAGVAGATRVVLVESSMEALEAARAHWQRNQLPLAAADFVRADVGRFLRETEEVFDLIVLDPPALAKQRKDVARAARAYKDLHLWAFRRAASEALMLTFSCSQHVDGDLFRKFVLAAAVDARRSVQLLDRLGPGPDHPIALGHPEGEYLHGLLLRVL